VIEPIAFPAVDADWTTFTTTRYDDRLAEVVDLADRLKDGSGRSAAEVLELWNRLQIALISVASEASLVSETHPDRDIRAGAEERVTRAGAIEAQLMADADLAAVFAATDVTGLDADALRLRDRVLRDFRRGGVDLDPATRAEVTRLADRDTELSLAFGRNIREGRREIRVTPDSLAGLPQDLLDSHPADADGLVTISTDYPDLMPVREYARDRATRLAISAAFGDLAWPENDSVLAELLEVRERRAHLLGYGNWADYETETRMVGSSASVARFLDEVDEASRDAMMPEYELLLERLQEDDPAATEVLASDLAYLLGTVRRERYDVDSQVVRSYFSFDRVLDGLLDTSARLFGLTYVPVSASTWHEDVRSYDVMQGDERIGRIHLDLHPREGKYNHAACFPMAPGVADTVLPEAALVCNFSRGAMEHDEVTTFFHEFGHLVHDILGGRQRWAPFSGVATEWDFVEAPSQMLEEWAWNHDVLRTFAHNDAGEEIPAALVERMRTADAFGRALGVRTQLGHARTSFHLHVDRPTDIATAVEGYYESASPVRRLPNTHSYAGFGHLTGYGSCYYTYQWSLVIARDLLTGFDADLMAPEPARRYRERILAPGGSRDAADLVEDFLGRPYSVEAYRSWLSQG
jgi:thimet oligopeptidase